MSTSAPRPYLASKLTKLKFSPLLVYEHHFCGTPTPTPDPACAGSADSKGCAHCRRPREKDKLRVRGDFKAFWMEISTTNLRRKHVCLLQRHQKDPQMARRSSSRPQRGTHEAPSAPEGGQVPRSMVNMQVNCIPPGRPRVGQVHLFPPQPPSPRTLKRTPSRT